MSRSLDADPLLREVESLFDGDSAIEIFVRPLAELAFAAFSELLPSRSTDESFNGVVLVFVNSDVGAGFFVKWNSFSFNILLFLALSCPL